MKLWKKIALGTLLLLVIAVGASAYFWFNRGAPPITVAEPGAGGQRVLLGDVPANYFAPSNPGPHPAILLLGGSEGSLRETRNIYARALAAQGYAVLYPGYYKTREDNRSFDMVPLETFDRALVWMAARPEIDASRMAVIGHSKGAEAALIVASRHPEIRAVVAAMPSDVVWQGFDFNATDMSKFRSSWSLKGQPLPFVRYKLLSWYEWFSSDALTKMYRQSWEQAARYPQAAIRVDQINAKILLVCGGDDLIWPSCEMARAIQARAPPASKESFALLSYPQAGHWAFGPVENLHSSDTENLGQMGGTAEMDMAARKDQWPKLLAFLRQSFDVK
jgi:dienelactone hydrolase